MREQDVFSTIINYQKSCPVDVFSLIEQIGIRLGIRLIDVDWNDEISGAIEKNPKGGYCISVNVNHPEVRRRFTAAHELGHYFLHREAIDQVGLADDRLYRSVDFKSYQNHLIGVKQEAQANRFAASILMPWRIVEKMKKEGVSVAEMAEKLKVSKAAMKIRYDSF